MSSFEEGQRVRYSGYVGHVRDILTGQLEGMANVRVPGGTTCVSLSELANDETEAETAARRAQRDEWARHVAAAQAAKGQGSR